MPFPIPSSAPSVLRQKPQSLAKKGEGGGNHWKGMRWLGGETISMLSSVPLIHSCLCLPEASDKLPSLMGMLPAIKSRFLALLPPSFGVAAGRMEVSRPFGDAG